MTGVLTILGGCGGIGRHLVTAATKSGWTPVVLDLAASIVAHPPGVRAVAVDATDPYSLRAAAAGIGSLKGFVNLCGFMGASKPVVDQEPAQWNELIDGNLTSAFHAAQAFAPHLKGGSMVMTGSGLGHFARPGYGAYAVAKAGIAALTRQFALELAPDIRVNAVAPGAVDTAFLRGGTGRSDEAQPSRFDPKAHADKIPLGRIAQPDDVTGPILFLLSGAAGYMTGQTLHINGGAYMP
jgi:3-oxoacyl-[acyl-carrier protein] reductase